MSKLAFFLTVCSISFSCNAGDKINTTYSVSTLYHGSIGNSYISMYLTASNSSVLGIYKYDKFKKNIHINGNKNTDSFILSEGLKVGYASIRLNAIKKGYQGQWCAKKCMPVFIQTKNSFRDGFLSGVKISNDGSGNYMLNMDFGSKKQEIIIPGPIDIPSLEFFDINGDGFYDLIARTDHRPDNGSQLVYLSTGDGFVIEDSLARVNGTLIYNPFNHDIIFHAKDDCCTKYSKTIYSFIDGDLKKINAMSFDYLSNKGLSSRGDGISKEVFESH